MSNDNNTTTVQASDTPVEGNNKRKKVLLGITGLFVLAGLGWAGYYKLVLSKEEQTDNAYVGGNLVTLSSQVTGNVNEIRADETQMVQAGAPLITLDGIDADLALSQAQARLGNVVRQERERYTGVAQYEAVVEQRRLALATAQGNLARRAPLAADHTISGEDLAHAKQAVDDAKAALTVAQRQADSMRAGVAGVLLASHPAVLSAKDDLVQAWLAVRRNAVIAPVSGYVAKRNVQLGSHVTPGTPLMSIVPLDQLWVDANFKESELRNIRVGQAATIETDLYGSKVVYHGKVQGMSAGTGSAFSLLPAQNATGNWIKVVQRVPVRIALDPKELATHPLRIGLSTTVTVDTSHGEGATLDQPMVASTVYSTKALSQPVDEAVKMADAIIAQNLAH
ncbi:MULTISPECIES: HlyD family efflux transporter periplasmic adaptor subunit [unclassified Janthinobacterium]|uniref:HlyD family secretion protein n=1 Tax=unclassified Janthinobacterium TaxID=2610881 RepID=UPI00161463D2|nr:MULTISPECIES: HlyD family efflux transporter periplasmic adaptor subunit [unclassified Janthinobacterium]MBB5368276.1 membrane fusion protein (multidrug efflux system) [Janthinobacterium sp. K2C7]MBB5382187.1 membrane fusion protein (multidrug efflux system) [Janthinobacterium sp. K2Li3]MBB5386658.1 membrane fusion protein (multidrug efflux system) [Janthinobacterium sp. K2E3]